MGCSEVERRPCRPCHPFRAQEPHLDQIGERETLEGKNPEADVAVLMATMGHARGGAAGAGLRGVLVRDLVGQP